MRRKDREVTDFNRMLAIIDECEIVHLGIAAGEFPYIVPVNFAYEVKDGQLYLYAHGAKAGRKYELLSQLGKCSFEMEVNGGIKVMPEKKDTTTIYKCVMGEAEVDILDDMAEIRRVVDEVIMARDERTAKAPYNEGSLARVAIYRLKVLSMTGKANPGQPDL